MVRLWLCRAQYRVCRMNMENSTAEKIGQEAAQQGTAAASPTSPTDKARTAQTSAVGAHTPLGLLLGGAAVVLALMVLMGQGGY